MTIGEFTNKFGHLHPDTLIVLSKKLSNGGGIVRWGINVDDVKFEKKENFCHKDKVIIPIEL